MSRNQVQFVANATLDVSEVPVSDMSVREGPLSCTFDVNICNFRQSLTRINRRNITLRKCPLIRIYARRCYGDTSFINMLNSMTMVSVSNSMVGSLLSVELTHTSLSAIRYGFAASFVNYKKGALDSPPQVIKITSCLARVGGFLRLWQCHDIWITCTDQCEI
jgi:hypothetical protein